MKILPVIAFFLMSVMCLQARPLDDGNQLFQKGDFEKALESYYSARSDMPDSRLLNYNIGTTLYKLGRFDEAKQELGQAVFAHDSVVARNATFNLGNVQYQVGKAAQKPADRIAAWREAIALYKKAIDQDPSYEASKRNVEIVQRQLKEELDKNKDQKDQDQKNNQEKQPPMSEAAKQARAKALQLCQKSRYAEALAVLDQVITADETATPLQEDKQRVQDVIDISEGREPSAPIQPSASNNQNLGVI